MPLPVEGGLVTVTDLENHLHRTISTKDDPAAQAAVDFATALVWDVVGFDVTGDDYAIDPNDLLIVKDAGSVIRGAVRVLNLDSGLVGIPKATEKGLDVTFLIDRETKLGGMLRLDSRMNKALNGDYSIDQLKFDVASHEDSFFYQAQCTRL